MHSNTQPLFPNSTPVTRSLPENPTSDLALPSLEHLVKALHAIAPSSGIQHSGNALQECLPAVRRGGHKYPTSDRHGRMPSCERYPSHRSRDRRMPSRDRRERPASSRERRAGPALALTPHHQYHAGAGYESDREAEHVPASPAPVRRGFETSSPKVRVGKMHYVPATPAPSAYSPKAASLKAYSPLSFKNNLPTPPTSHPSSSPKQHPSSPPKRHYTPAPAPASPTLSSPSLPPKNPATDAAFSKLKRFVLAGRETAADHEAVESLMEIYERVMGSFGDEDMSDADTTMD
ncbi:hypothetical protein BDV93DRAFT_524079 [Ceratobasidium sp. AG-I]|nr:hypothetical protein BDV93DRAFT_524079 [Ceratobasidium sp. AG-I]